MSLKNRQKGQQETKGYMGSGVGPTGGFDTETRIALPPVQLVSGREYFSVVDGEIVNVIGTTDLPGMSLAWLCQSDEDGSVAPISHKEAPLFTTAQRALQFRDDQRGLTRRPLP